MNPRINLRYANISDIKSLLELENEIFSYDRINSRSFWHAITHGHCSLIVAGRHGLIEGYAYVRFRRGSNRARLYSLGVKHSVQRQGVGSKLLSEAEREASKAGYDYLCLEVKTDNFIARTLYQKSGYVEYGIRKAYYGDQSDACLYIKRLNRSRS